MWLLPNEGYPNYSMLYKENVELMNGIIQWNNVIMQWIRYLFSDWPKAYGEFPKSAPVTSWLQIIQYHVKDTQLVTGNHVMYDRGAWSFKG